MNNDRTIKEYEYTIPYHWMYSGFWLKQYLYPIKRVAEYLEHLKTGPILDLGCSDGRLTYEMARLIQPRGIKVIGVDMQDTAIEFAKLIVGKTTENPVFKKICLGIDSIKELEPHGFEMITMFDFIEHIPVEQVANLLLEAYQSLNDKGM